MHVLFTTTVDASFSILLSTWLTVLLYSISHTVIGPDAIADIQYSVAVGCMPSKDHPMKPLLGGALHCTHIPDIPGFENEGKKHHQKFSVSYPDVRRMMMTKAFASSGLYDLIIYADLDAFIVHNPLPELLQLKSEGYAFAASRDHYNKSTICNGFYALYDMSLPTYWLSRAVYGQNELNAWLHSDRLDGYQSFYSEFHLKRPDVKYTRYVPKSQLTTNNTYKIKLLSEPDYFRGGCGDVTSLQYRKVEHCLTDFYSGKAKINNFIALQRLLAHNEVEDQVVSSVLSRAHVLSTSYEHILNVTNFVYVKRESKKLSSGSDYWMEIRSQRLNITTHLVTAIQQLSRWSEVASAFQLDKDSTSVTHHQQQQKSTVVRRQRVVGPSSAVASSSSASVLLHRQQHALHKHMHAKAHIGKQPPVHPT